MKVKGLLTALREGENKNENYVSLERTYMKVLIGQHECKFLQDTSDSKRIITNLSYYQENVNYTGLKIRGTTRNGF